MDLVVVLELRTVIVLKKWTEGNISEQAPQNKDRIILMSFTIQLIEVHSMNESNWLLHFVCRLEERFCESSPSSQWRCFYNCYKLVWSSDINQLIKTSKVEARWLLGHSRGGEQEQKMTKDVWFCSDRHTRHFVSETVNKNCAGTNIWLLFPYRRHWWFH